MCLITLRVVRKLTSGVTSPIHFFDCTDLGDQKFNFVVDWKTLYERQLATWNKMNKSSLHAY